MIPSSWGLKRRSHRLNWISQEAEPDKQLEVPAG